MKFNKDKFTELLANIFVFVTFFGIWVYVFLQIADGKF